MNALHNVVACGMVLYLGISDTPAWVVADANRYAIDHGKTPFVIYQGAWSIMLRDFERDILPMALAEGESLFRLVVRTALTRPRCRHGARTLECPCGRKDPH